MQFQFNFEGSAIYIASTTKSEGKAYGLLFSEEAYMEEDPSIECIDYPTKLFQNLSVSYNINI